MPVYAENKYRLRDLHHEIDYFDRKIAHCTSFEAFDSEQQRTDALRKLETKRGTLVKAADALVVKGIKFDPKDLPRSFKKDAESCSNNA